MATAVWWCFTAVFAERKLVSGSRHAELLCVPSAKRHVRTLDLVESLDHATAQLTSVALRDDVIVILHCHCPRRRQQSNRCHVVGVLN